MRVVYTLIQAKKFPDYAEAGAAINSRGFEDALMYNYKMLYVQGGVVVQVLDGSRNLGYL